MKKRNIALSLCLAAMLGALSSCASSAESPFAYTISTESFAVDDYVRTFGYKSETLSTADGAEYYVAGVYLQYFGADEVNVRAEDFTLAYDGAEYAGTAFVSLTRVTSCEYEEGGSYIETAAVEAVGAEYIGLARTNTAACYYVSFSVAALPEEFSLCYSGSALGEMSGDEKILSSDFMQADGVRAAKAEGGMEYYRAGATVTKYTAVNETKVNASYGGVCLRATIGNESVAVSADKFTLKTGDDEYTCLGFVESSFYTEEDGLLTVTTQKITLSDTAILRSEDISELNLSFGVQVADEYALYYNGVKL